MIFRRKSKILLIDADSTIPNLALMKLAQYYKNTKLLQLHLPYYPNKKKKYHIINTTNYKKVFCSVVFEGNKKYIRDIYGKQNDIIFGGTGVDLKTILPKEIQKLKPNYSIYPDNNISYGFISRGCIRNCKFCKVPKKEGKIHQVNTIEEIVQHKKVKFLDNNILALPNHIDILKELRDKRIKCCFNQGLDIRLVNKENSKLLKDLNYIGEYVFALDDVKSIKIVKNKLKLLSWRKAWGLKFFVYVHPNMKIQDTIKRIQFLKDNKCLAYVMRDISCYSSKLNKFYSDLSAWCNQPGLFKNLEFNCFLEKRYNPYKNQTRIKYCNRIYNKGGKNEV